MLQPNVVILTSGLTGSSVLTALIARAGYWTGDSTQMKEDYDTHENKELTRLNRELFRKANYTGNYTTEFCEPALEQIAALHGRIDLEPYRAFLRICEDHGPWVWKDPRLWLTIRFWGNLLNLRQCRFILLTRGYTQSWISTLLRRQIRSYADYTSYENGVKATIENFFRERRIAPLHLTYESLIMKPEETLRDLNVFLGTGLRVEDLKAVYHKPLFKNPRPSLFNYGKAVLIYLKNYRAAAQQGSSR